MREMQPFKEPLRKPISRRTFLRTLSFTLSGTLLAACGPPRGDDRAAVRIAFGPQATPQTILPSPMPKATSMPATDVELLSLEEFLTLSTGLTGVANLDPELGQIYLQSLNTTHGAAALTDLYTTAGLPTAENSPPVDLPAGVTAEAPQRALAATITKLWYSGIYPNAAGEATVATYVDALAWKTLAFTKPKTICGEPGFWSEAWEVVLD